MKIRKILLGVLASAMFASLFAITSSAQTGAVAINEKNFPDENFRQYVLDNFDKDKNSSLSEKEISSVYSINVVEKGISSLKGIELFSNLEDLYSYDNKLTSLDLSKNTALTSLNCRDNQLTSLDVSKNMALKGLCCYNNQLTSIDVSGCTALTVLVCTGNQLTCLDVSKNTALEVLWCHNNQLTSLDVSKNTALTNLNCGWNKLTSLGVSKNTALEELWCPGNKLTYLDLNNNPLIENLSTDENITIYGKSGSFAETYTKENDIKFVAGSYMGSTAVAINKKNFPDKNFRQYVLDECDKNGDKNLSKKEINSVVSIDVNDKFIDSLKGIEYFVNLEELYCYSNELTSLDVSKNTALEKLYCGDNKLTSLDVSKNTVLDHLECTINKLTSLDIRKNTALTELYCYSNQLKALDVSKNTKLTILLCFGNQLTSIDVSKNAALTNLACWDNDLTSLDVSKNTALEYLYCSENQLTSLDVSNNTALKQLDCSSNQLTSLDVSKNTALEELSCYNDQLTSLDLNNNPLLCFLSTDEDITIYGKSGSFAEKHAKYSGIKFVAGKPPVSKPTGLTAKSGSKQISLKWNAVSGATKYRVQRKTSDGWKTIARTKNNSCKIKGLKNGKTYTYRVSAYVDGNWGKSSASLKAKAGA